MDDHHYPLCYERTSLLACCDLAFRMAFTHSAVVLVLCAVLATTAHSTKEWHEGVLFSNVATADIGSTNKKSRVSGNYEAPELRQICLREVKVKDCQPYGCKDTQICGTGDCELCETESSLQTELACCNDQGDYSEAAVDGLAADSLTALDGKVGACDWTFDTYLCETGVYGPDCTNGFVLSDTNVEKIGTVWGTCYFNSNSESCGHPLGDRMVMSIQGGFYAMPAYVGLAGSIDPPRPDVSCAGAGRRMTEVFRKSANHTKVMQQALKKDPMASDQQALGKNNDGRDRLYATGLAFVVSGPVTVTSLHHHMEYNRGILEWVHYFKEVGAPISTPPSGLNPVVPYTMTVTLASSGDSDDTYQPRVDQGVYGNEGYHNN